MIVFFMLAIVSFCYGLLIMLAASGSKFFFFWFAMGAYLLLCGCGMRCKWYLLMPKWLLCLACIALCLGAGVFISLTVRIGRCFESKCDTPLDYIIVLGAQVRENGPSVVLKYRLDSAAEYLEQNPSTICIVTGAKGSNEPVTEARGMADYLIARGIDENRIILEEKALNTAENIRYSKAFLPGGDATVGIVTNDFHMYRALGIAKKEGLDSASGLASGSVVHFLPNNVTREVLGVIKDTYCGNMILW